MCENVENLVAKRHILHSGIMNQTMRDWQSFGSEIYANNLVYPVFIIENDDEIQYISSMPGISRYGINRLKNYLSPLVQNGLVAILVFGVIEKLPKTNNGDHADSLQNPVIKALPKLRSWFPELTIICDVCLCPYTSHGHCGILDKEGVIQNEASIKRIAQIATAYAKAGAHIVAPSDMMDGRIGAIKQSLIKHGLSNSVALLSYSCKFASNFYGPFRDAAKSAPAFGDRKKYQLPSGSTGLALRAAARDVDEGADMLMVKPVFPYTDILKAVKIKFPDYPMAVYQTSGEFSMISKAAEAGVFQLRDGLMEILSSYRRAGADIIITYFAPQILEWIKLKNKL